MFHSPRAGAVAAARQIGPRSATRFVMDGRVRRVHSVRMKILIAGGGAAGFFAAIEARGFRPADDNEADAIALLLWATDPTGGRA